MKWSIVGLVCLGVVAALSAVVLMVTLQNSAQAAPGPAQAAAAPVEVQVVVAARELKTRSVVEAADMLVRSVEASAAPRDALADPVQAIGKVLITPLREGQAFTADAFATDSHGLQLAAALADGKRAVSLDLKDSMGLEELLYPGCLVDVIATIMTDDQDLGLQTMSITLLESVLVLAIGQQTIVTPGGSPEEGYTRTRRPSVTLLLEADQVEALKLAMEKGSVSLSLRNPLDDAVAGSRGTRLANLSPVLAEAEQKKAEESRRKRDAEAARHRQELEAAREEAELLRERMQNEIGKKRESEETATWQAVIVRGGKMETRTFSERGLAQELEK